MSTQLEQRLPSALTAVQRPMSRAWPISMTVSAETGLRASAFVNGWGDWAFWKGGERARVSRGGGGLIFPASFEVASRDPG